MATYAVIRVNGSTTDVATTRKGSALLREVCKEIGADTIDTVNLRDGRVMLVDDTGMVDGKPRNEQATQLYWSVCKPGIVHPICGDVAIAMDEDFA